MKNCRECGREVSEWAFVCPNCGAPRPAKANWDGYGFEYKSQFEVLGLPFIHVSFKYNRNRIPVVARGVIAIGQFAAGIISVGQFAAGMITIAQFGIGIISVSQLTVALYALAQVGLCVFGGYGQVVKVLF